MSAKLAAVVPVGYLDRMGYQHTAAICEEGTGWAVDGLMHMPTIDRFERNGDGSPHFDAHVVMDAVNEGIETARELNFDAAIVLMCNNYIYDWISLGAEVEGMLEANEPFRWYYRLDQLADWMFGPSVRLPWIINLRHGAELRFGIDSLVVDGETSRMERGNYNDWPIVVDVQLEMTREDLAEKMNFIRCYSDLVPKRNPVFDWGYWFPYYVDKFKKKQRYFPTISSKAARAIAANSRPDFVSHEVLKCLG